MLATTRTVIIGLILWLLPVPVLAGSVSQDEIKGLDEQVQDIKVEVLSIAAELGRLEEKLLYPSGTQVALFVSLAEGETFRLDAVDIRIDGKEVASHLYTYKELEALAQGGIQRIYTGNISQGERELEVTVSGKSETGADYRLTRTASIDKGIGPKQVEIRLAGPGSRHPGIDIRDR
ncbi:hypothetical protein CAI21_16805 [Alkalilimnicola ehrlichii]|uniref:AraC family transcriptional regulator n=1 Tax=Alkalilimnicola ehrlichii TaxID=351052 RepID=A0A3E0WG26_9GAMM|nr:hypothetical protein [Alkalilimnicola ehrlichii]RFA26615.1 hypothetical protein CAI21_16805 [Alkalilimnicola ehrlichii]RFA31892.1 hypothetical protein CAL65_21230 [Alkalilimnicola ehrlichii]